MAGQRLFFAGTIDCNKTKPQSLPGCAVVFKTTTAETLCKNFADLAFQLPEDSYRKCIFI
jgi:hypothetical protein